MVHYEKQMSRRPINTPQEKIRSTVPVGSTLLTSYVLHFNCGYTTQTNLKIPCVICGISPRSFVILLTGLKKIKMPLFLTKNS